MVMTPRSAMTSKIKLKTSFVEDISITMLESRTSPPLIRKAQSRSILTSSLRHDIGGRFHFSAKSLRLGCDGEEIQARNDLGITFQSREEEYPDHDDTLVISTC
ncbi:hypothetical protein BHM03_00038160 [Ensete ventricosum]|nr:hypothetical protein BHM03_00038160 [Ensete ventricosum]